MNGYGIFESVVICWIIIIVGIILFVIFLAWLAGGGSKKPEVHIYQPPPIQQHPPPSMGTHIKYCPNCRAQVPIHSKFCNECGYRF